MNMVIPNEGKTLILDELFRLTSTRESFVVDLFSSNTTVVNASTATDFTIATFTGYAQVAIARGGFSPAVVVGNEGNINVSAFPQWTCTGGGSQTVFGWIMRGATSGKIYAGQNFDVARVMAPGATEQLNPFTLKDKTYA